MVKQTTLLFKKNSVVFCCAYPPYTKYIAISP